MTPSPKNPSPSMAALLLAALLAITLPFATLLATPLAASAAEGWSFLDPDAPKEPKPLHFTVDAINPPIYKPVAAVPDTDRKKPKKGPPADDKPEPPKFLVPVGNKLILYTPAAGASIPANGQGTVVLVQNGTVTKPATTPAANTPIPLASGSYALIGYGATSQWVARFLKPGVQIAIEPSNDNVDPGKTKIVVNNTPAVYRFEIDQILAEIAKKTNGNDNNFLSSTRSCQTALSELPDEPLTIATLDQGETCLKNANLAFYETVSPKPDEFRGAWVRPDSTDPAKIAETVQHLKQVHITDVFLETYFQGKTIYPSAVMREYGLPEQHPRYNGADMLKLWLDAAHAEGLKVHTWTQVFFAGNATENSEHYGPILQKYPQWTNVQRPHWKPATPVITPFISNVEPGHYFLDPANAEARAFLKKLILEIASYPIDGMNLDYIRYPASARLNQPNYLSTTWGYTETAREQFKTFLAEDAKKQGKPLPKSPSADPKDFTIASPYWSKWVEWRQEQITTFVRDVSSSLHGLNQKMLVSAVVFPHSDPTYAQKLQDYPRWVAEGSIQALTPIGLSTNPSSMYEQSLKLKKDTANKVPVYVGIFGMYNRQSPAELLTQIDTLHKADMPGLVLFEWSRITPEYEEALLTGPFRK